MASDDDTDDYDPQGRETYETESWCPSCGKDTPQVFVSDGHERDSSWDRRTCKTCGKSGLGLDGFKEYR